MSTINLKSGVISTFLTKVAILLLNFGTVALTTRLWGAEGRGFISLFIADLQLIAILTNVFTGSSVSYYISKLGRDKLMSQAYLITFLLSGVASVILSLIGKGSNLPLLLFIVATFLGYVTFHNSLYIGTQKINYFNLMSILQPLLLLLFTITFNHTFKRFDIHLESEYYAYFYGQILSIIIVLILCHILTRKTIGSTFHFTLDKETVKKSFDFGWQTELSNLLQFFNYRLSYYFLGMLSGIASVGIFSVGVMLSEAIWTVSKSISVVQYSNVLKQGDNGESLHETKSMSLISLTVSAAFIGILLLLPQSLFSWIFGPQFSGVKRVVLFLAPGILAIAASNVIGNYFSAIGRLKVLILKSALGLVVTVLLSFLLIPRLAIDGACIVNSASYIVSSVILIVAFMNHRQSMQMRQ